VQKAPVYDNEEKFFDKAAFSVTLDAGCETGGGVSRYGNRKGGPSRASWASWFMTAYGFTRICTV
jgi:hypothetical protein